MRRREFVGSLAGAAAAAPAPGVPPSVLVHEHVLVDFRDAATQQASPANLEEAFQVMKPRLEEAARLGCVRFLDCTPRYIGRAPRLLARLAAATGIDIWTNTGWYAARNRQYLPPEAITESASQIASRWRKELEQGVDGMKPRFIKIGVNSAPLHPVDRKIVLAAALVARDLGVTVASHTGGGGPAAMEQMQVFQEAKTELSKFVWVHADSEKDLSYHERAVRAGAWVEFDHVSAANLERHLEALRYLADRGLLYRTLISQDAGYYRPGETNGGAIRPYSYLYTDFLSKLEPSWVQTLMLRNPITAFGGSIGK